VTTAPPVLSVSLDKDGIPIFPSVDIDKLSPDEARTLLHDYVEASWSTLTSNRLTHQLFDHVI